MVQPTEPHLGSLLCFVLQPVQLFDLPMKRSIEIELRDLADCVWHLDCTVVQKAGDRLRWEGRGE